MVDPVSMASRATAEQATRTGDNGVRLVVGASRGIGLALLEEQLKDEGSRKIIATHRPGSLTPALLSLAREWDGKLELVPLDVTRDDSIEQFSEYLQGQDDGIDLAIHAAGILHEQDIAPEKTYAQCNAANLKRLFEVNSIGPLMVAGALLSAQPRKKTFVFAALSAMVGSIADNRLGGWYGYRASKTALNQFIKTLANECRFTHPHAAIVAIHPGTTDTELSRPFQKNVKPGKLYSPGQTASRILSVVKNVDAQQSGRFINWDGSQIPW